MVENVIEVKNRYSPKTAKGLRFTKDNPKSVSRTQQHFKKEANINCIIKKANKSGLLTNPLKVPTRMPQFGDFSQVSDFQSMQNKMVEIKTYFDSLPAEIRKRFDNDPQKLLTFMSDDNNKQEALKLGLISHNLENIKYIRKDENGNEIDVTQEVIDKRGLFVNGKRVNIDGTPYKKPEQEAPPQTE